MPPSKRPSDQFILELLAQNLAKQGGERKRKKEVDGKGNMAIIEPSAKKHKAKLERVDKSGADEYEKRSPKVKGVKTEVNISAEVDDIAQCVVYHHLKEVSPKLADEFAASHKFLQSSVKLEDVVEAYFNKCSAVNKKSHKLVKQKTNSKVGWTRTKYSTEEDEVIRKAVNKAKAGGEDIDYLALGTQLKRKRGSVYCRVRLLNRNGGVKEKRKSFTLIEDQIILETLVIPRLRTEKLTAVILGRSCCKELAELWKIDTLGLGSRWTSFLQPTLLQHYSGTLNLKVERMLANHISDSWSDFAEINWVDVASRSEFVGHTEKSLRNLYMMLSRNSRYKSGLPNCEVTPQHIAQYTEEAYGEGGKGAMIAGTMGCRGKKIGLKKMIRKKGVIAFFLGKVAELNIENFI